MFKTHPDAPRVLIANSNLVPKWATWEHFNELDRKGLMMFGQMTAGSWIYIGSQGIVQGTYETFAEAGRQHYGGDLAGKWILTAGLGGMGGAQPLAATMAGASMLAIECQQSRIDMRLATRYLDRQAKDLDDALAILRDACARKAPVSVGLLGNAAEILPELVRRGVRPDMVTDQTSAHDLVNGYLPAGWTRRAVAGGAGRSARSTRRSSTAAKQSIAAHVEAMLAFHAQGIPTFDYGNNIRQVAFDEGVADAFAFPGFVPAYIRPLFCEGKGPFRWVALSGDPEDIYKTDRKVKELFPDNAHLHRWLDMARERIAFQGLPARICWLGLGERHLAGLAFNEMVKTGELKAPIVIGRDHLDTGSVAIAEPRDRGDGATAPTPCPTGRCSTRCSTPRAARPGCRSITAAASAWATRSTPGVVIVCDGTDAAAKRIARVLWNDPGDRRHAPRRRRLRERRSTSRRRRASTCRCCRDDVDARRRAADRHLRARGDGDAARCRRHPRSERGRGQRSAHGNRGGVRARHGKSRLLRIHDGGAGGCEDRRR